MSSRHLTRLDIERFAYGEDDSLEAIIFDNPEYLRALEEIWDDELPRDFAPTIVRSLRFHKFVSNTATTTIDVGLAMGRAIPHYLFRVSRFEAAEESADGHSTNGGGDTPHRPESKGDDRS